MWTVLVFIMLVGLVGLAIDFALIVTVSQQLQLGADASALAGAAHVRTDQDMARVAARDMAQQNRAAGSDIELDLNVGNSVSGDIVLGRYDRDLRQFTPTATAVNAVQVTTRRSPDNPDGPLPLIFGPIFNTDEVDIERTAIAMVGGGTGAGIITLDPHADCAFSIRGNPTVLVNGGDVQINSDSDCAGCYQGDFTLVSPNVNSVGENCITGRAGDLDTNLNPDSPFVEDPLAWLPEPTWDPSADLGSVAHQNGDLTLSPGFYSGGISATGGNLTLESGIYILDGAGLDISGNTNLSADGVTLFLSGSGHLDLTGTGVLYMRPPDPSVHFFPDAALYEGVMVFQARDNDTDNRIIGTSNMDIEGTMYFPAGHVDISGTADKIGTQFVANTMEISGNGVLELFYDGRFPAPGNRVFLVE